MRAYKSYPQGSMDVLQIQNLENTLASIVEKHSANGQK